MDILDVEKSKCIGCGACVSIDDEHFFKQELTNNDWVFRTRLLKLKHDQEEMLKV